MIRLILLVALVAVAWYTYRAFRRGGTPAAAPQELPPAPEALPAGKLVGTAENFAAEVLEGSRGRPVLVDFWAPWCGPCRMLSPILDTILERYAGRITLVTVNVDEQAELAARFDIRGIPAVKLFRDGAVADEFVGLRSARQIEWMLDQQLPPKDDAPA